jgi:hypothetical protein
LLKPFQNLFVALSVSYLDHLHLLLLTWDD